MDATALPLPAADYALRMRCWEHVREFLRDMLDDIAHRINTQPE